ncbi:jg14593 [Pararge aegeria aegeria]|uniref:Jg14593 protein n=1 Tax=Pararge aegeria aegeria TaxID=348720 RepID=A0A8S4R1U6_9NEOP|nr:jg14593 [Pararge aegeria aegeria]
MTIDTSPSSPKRLIAVYRNDDTTRIKRATEAINHRYNELNNSIVARGKALHSAVSSLQNFDRSLEKFVAWLSEAESLLDAAERDPHLLKIVLRRESSLAKNDTPDIQIQESLQETFKNEVPVLIPGWEIKEFKVTNFFYLIWSGVKASAVASYHPTDKDMPLSD